MVQGRPEVQKEQNGGQRRVVIREGGLCRNEGNRLQHSSECDLDLDLDLERAV